MSNNNSQYRDILNPFAALIESGIEIRSELATAARDLTLAIDNLYSKRQTAKELKRIYEEMEAEVTAEVMFGTTATNDKARKAELDAALVKARRDGYLSRAWAQMNAAQADLEEAESAHEQAAKRFRATEAAADLTAAMLKAAMG